MEKQDSQDFYSHAPRGARLCCCSRDSDIFLFLLTRPSRGATVKLWFIICSVEFFYSHAPRGARPVRLVRPHSEPLFLLTRPSRGATTADITCIRDGKISTHTPLAGRDKTSKTERHISSISTHTPLAGRDEAVKEVGNEIAISTHTPLAGRDQPERSGRRNCPDFYSHAPRGARHYCL